MMMTFSFELTPGTILTAYVAGIFCNVTILLGYDVGFTVAVDPRGRSITETANIATVIITLWSNISVLRILQLFEPNTDSS